MEFIRVEDCCEILDSQRKPITESERVPGRYPYYGANGIQGTINQYIFDGKLVLVAEDGGHFGSKTKSIAYLVMVSVGLIIMLTYYVLKKAF